MPLSVSAPKFFSTMSLMLCALALAGCASGTEAPSESSSSSASSAAGADSSGSSTASAGGTAVASASVSAGAVVGGEYEPADEHGPARNVKKPVEPEGMGVETPEAMEKFIYYWNDLRNYAIQTGDTTEIRKYTAGSFETYVKNFAGWDEIYRTDGWVAGGLVQPAPAISGAVSLGDGFYAIPINYDTTDALAVDTSGEKPYYEAIALSEDNGTGYELKIHYADSGDWYVIDQKIVGAQ